MSVATELITQSKLRQERNETHKTLRSDGALKRKRANVSMDIASLRDFECPLNAAQRPNMQKTEPPSKIQRMQT
jgi:hypothetical protein